MEHILYISLFLQIIIIISLIYLIIRERNENLEEFHNMSGKYKQSNRGCGHVADVGYVCPFIYSDGDVVIKQFNECNKEIQYKIAEYIFSEWKQEIGIKDVYGALEFIERHWSSTDVFYVMMKHDTEELIGCVGIDRDNFYPYISHLYIIPEHRKKNHSLTLMKFSEKIIKDMSFTEARLWCVSSLKDFYEKQGYVIENNIQKKGVENLIMVKRI